MDITVYGVVVTGVIIGLLEIAKGLGLNTKYVPIVSVILGVLSVCVYGSGNVAENVLVGLAVGLSAVGLYSTTKNVLEKAGDEDEDFYNRNKSN